MPVPPLHDPAHIETRLLVVAEMLEKAVAEVHRALAAVKSETHQLRDLTLDRPSPDDKPNPGVTDG